ncbi:hypothetical protein [Streptomyces sp. H39-S7]|uniref:hypothetical protein n=1 Tax=Streptomyces sp. H39-S7 TaxID=3004357 RepID=UPI0022AF4D3B|nr:hypothetical protein [Streptomyces sp. H39-S7]MCZ4124375.1 hypothetical protein [Streptomyces sp. H39-S7]
MSDVVSKNQGLQSEYEARVAADLRQNEGDRDRVLAQIDALQKELEILVQDREMLLSMQSAVGATKQAAPEPAEPQASEPEARVAPHAKSKVPGARRRTARKSVPTQGRAGRGRKTDAASAVADAAHAAKAPAKAATTKATATKTATKTPTKTVTEKPAKASTAKSATAKPAKATAAKTATPKAADTKAAAAPKADKLVKVVENFLLKQGAPASAAEVATAISTPERAVTIMSVRTALEGLVRKSAALRSKQSRSVYYEAVPAGTVVTAAVEAPQQSESVTQ